MKKNKEEMKYPHRYLARIILKAETALAVGSGETALLKDGLVQRDHHGFPMIQGSSLAGVLRHALIDPQIGQTLHKELKHFFGFQEKKKGLGSKVKISSAYLLLPTEKEDQIAEGLVNPRPDLLSWFEDLPRRNHVRINHQGVADKEDKGLFENEVLYKGCRFIFELEVKGDQNDKGYWEALLKQVNHPHFRVGQGTRKGYGKLSVESIRAKEFDLKTDAGFEAYLHFDPSLNAPNDSLVECTSQYPGADDEVLYYQLDLKPDQSFMIFNSGVADQEVDNTPLTEMEVLYKDGEMKFVEKTVVPASSIKGALSHRTCFHFNQSQKVWAENRQPADFAKITGSNNEAVKALFGEAADEKNNKGQRGQVIMDDLFLDDAVNELIFNHVAIDRFTGGSRSKDGALFSEKVSKVGSLSLKVGIEGREWKKEKEIKNAFEQALADVCKGLLPLGGMTTKGHGIFTGTLTNLNEERLIYDYDAETI